MFDKTKIKKYKNKILFVIFSALLICSFLLYKNIKSDFLLLLRKYAQLDDRIESSELKIINLQKDGFVEKPTLANQFHKINQSTVLIGGEESLKIGKMNEETILTSTFSQISGTGFILSKKGYIATAAHVISGLSTIYVLDSNGITHEAKKVSIDALNDIAVIKINASNLIPVELGSLNNMRVGDEVGLIGYNPGYSLPLLHKGSISGVGLNSNGYKLFTINSFVNRGNSGGPVFSLETGKVIGIVGARTKDMLTRPLLNLNDFDSGLTAGGVDPVRMTAELYNDSVRLVEEVSQVGIGIIYGIEGVRAWSSL